MDRIEFLSILRESLEGCIPLEDVEENVTFYRNYFDNADGSEQEVIQELGDPRLIARTIIEAYKASKGPMADYYTEKARSEYSREHSEYHDESGSNSWSEEDTGYSKAEQIKRWIIGIGIVAVVLAILALALKIFVVFLLPVILIIFVVKLIMDYFDR